MLIVAVAALCVAGSAVAEDRTGGLIGSGTRAEESNVAGQMVGSGGFTTTTQDQWMGNGGRAETSEDGGYLGSGLSIVELRLWDGSSLLVVSSDEGTFVIPIEE